MQPANASRGAPPSLCEVGGPGGMVFPLFGDGENEWPEALRAVLYCAGMIYYFVGVAIIADAFVAAIEVITARKRQRRTKSGMLVTDKVWNDTVATLSLMALGSSAPEIALSVIDLFKKDFHFTPLGAQTIAGSAAFNLLVIVAVCIIIIPSTEIRKIEELPAFYVTALVSVFAYFWLAIILILRTPDVVEIWEAVATFLMLPMLIWVSYKVDVGGASWCLSRIAGKRREDEAEDGGTMPVLDFPADEIIIEADPSESKTLQVSLRRPAGLASAISVQYRTEHLSAVAGFDYNPVSGALEFSEDTREQIIEVEILPKPNNRCSRKFLLFLEDMVGPAEFDADADGGKEYAIMTVSITTPPGRGSGLSRSIDSFVNLNGIRLGLSDWRDQIVTSIVRLGFDDEDGETSKLDWVLHLLALPWKIIFCVVPPTSLFGGWACFYVALAWIAALTLFISDLAELFGCVLKIRDDVTAITFVALGTSMPDLFASLSAAKEEPTADASIVNVTGSNSVNVFLGLGLPWTIGAVYWSVKGQTSDWLERYPSMAAQVGPGAGGAFVVESRNLGFCVLIFGLASTVTLLIVHLRRRFLGAELGGPFVPKVASFAAFIMYWLGFITVASWRVDRWSVATNMEMSLVIGSVGILEIIMTILAIACIIVYRTNPSRASAESSSQEPGGMRRSQSGLSASSMSAMSAGSNVSRGSKSSRGSRGVASEGARTVTVGAGLALPTGVTGVRGASTEGISVRVVKPSPNAGAAQLRRERSLRDR